MSGTKEELEVAREALVRARGDLTRQLDAEPAWHELKQLDARIASATSTAGIDFEAARADILAQLDANVPQWRTLADIDAAIAALWASSSSRSPHHETLAPPGPSSSAPHVKTETERTRFASRSRPAAIVPQSSGRGLPPITQTKSRAPETPPTPQRQPKSTGGRLAAALGLVGEGPARLSAIESEVERLMRRDAGTLDQLPATAPLPPRRFHPLPVEPDDDPTAYGDEAEVEIVLLTPISRRDDRTPITTLSDRLNRVDGRSEPAPEMEPVVSMHAHSEEAVVEIEVSPTETSEPPAGLDKDTSTG